MNKKLTLNRIQRDCPWNGNAADRVARGESADLIYDFEVLCDGILIAVWKKLYRNGRGYELCDLGGEPVRAPWFDVSGVRHPEEPRHNWYRVSADSQKEFIELVERDFDYIPSQAQVELRQAAKQRAREQEEAEKAEADRIYQIKEAGPDMLTVLKRLSRLKPGESLSEGDVESISAAIAQAEAVPA